MFAFNKAFAAPAMVALFGFIFMASHHGFLPTALTAFAAAAVVYFQPDMEDWHPLFDKLPKPVAGALATLAVGLLTMGSHHGPEPTLIMAASVFLAVRLIPNIDQD